LVILSLVGCAGKRLKVEEWVEVVEPPVLHEIVTNMPDTEVARLINSAQKIRNPRDEEAVYLHALGLLTAPHEQRHRWGVLLLLGKITGLEDASETWLREAHRNAMRYHNPDSIAVFATSIALGEFLFQRGGHTAEVLDLAAHAEGALHSDHSTAPQALIKKIRVGRLLLALHEWERGEALLKNAMRSQNHFNSPFNPRDYSTEVPPSIRALAFSALGRARHKRHETEQAISYLESAATAWGEVGRYLTRSEHLQKAADHMLLGNLFLDRKKFRRAELEFFHAANKYDLLQFPQERAKALSGMADILIRRGDYKQARDLLTPSYAILKDPPNSYLAYTASLYARALKNMNDDRAAETVLAETFALYERGLISIEDAAYFAEELSLLQRVDGRLCEAQSMAYKSMALLAKSRPDRKWTEKELRPEVSWNGKRCSEPIASQ